MGELGKRGPASLPMTKSLFRFSGEKAPRMTSENTERDGLCHFPCWPWRETAKGLGPRRPCTPFGEALLRAAEWHRPPSAHCPSGFTSLKISATWGLRKSKSLM